MSESFYDEEELDDDLYDEDTDDEDEDSYDDDDSDDDGLDDPDEDIDGDETFNPDEDAGAAEDDELEDPAFVDNIPRLLTDISVPIGIVKMSATGDVTVDVTLEFENIPTVSAFEVNPPLS